MDQHSGVGVLDKAVAILAAVEGGAQSLGALQTSTGLPRATAHRLAFALEAHRLLDRDPEGRWTLGPRLVELAAHRVGDPLVEAAGPVLARLRDWTGESAQLYIRRGQTRVCVAAAEPHSGLRDTVPVGAALPMTAGSAAQVLLAWEPRERAAPLLAEAAFTPRTLAEVRRRGLAARVAQREPGVASVSAPVRGARAEVVAAVSVSGPVDRLTRNPGARHGGAVLAAAAELGRRT